MAQIGDVPHVLRSIGTWAFIKRIWAQVSEDGVFTWGAALAYSWMFAIFPFLIFLLSLVPLLPQQLRQDFKPTVSNWIDTTIPSSDAAEIIKAQALPILDKPSSGGFLSFGLILTIWAASGGMSMTMSALDKAYDIEKSRGFIKHRLVAICLTFAVATLVIAVAVLLPIGTGVTSWLIKHGKIFGWMVFLIDVIRYAIALLLLIAITAIIYYFGPNLKTRFHAVTPGAVFSIIVWLLMGIGFRIYITKFGGAANYNKTYGAVAGLVILLLLFYVDGLVLLVGAEINSELDFAVAGIPSGERPEERAVAPIHSEENDALAKELQSKRADCDDPANADSPDCQKEGKPRVPYGTGRTLITLGGLWAMVKIVTSFARQPKKTRRQTNLPITRAALAKRYRVIAKDMKE